MSFNACVDQQKEKGSERRQFIEFFVGKRRVFGDDSSSIRQTKSNFEQDFPSLPLEFSLPLYDLKFRSILRELLKIEIS